MYLRLNGNRLLGHRSWELALPRQKSRYCLWDSARDQTACTIKEKHGGGKYYNDCRINCYNSRSRATICGDKDQRFWPPRTRCLRFESLLVDRNFYERACSAHKRGKPKAPPRVLENQPIRLCQKEERVRFDVGWNAGLIKLRAHFQQCHQRSARTSYPIINHNSWNYSYFMRTCSSITRFIPQSYWIT